MSAPPNPFSFDEITQNENVPLPEPVLITATDGMKLAVRSYEPQSPKVVIVFLHGGGAHSGAGYQCFASKLSSEYGMAVYTPDIRGHGSSGGDKGDSPTVEQVWKDVSTVLAYAVAQHQGNDGNGEAKLPLVLGGHSSGGALGYKSGTARLGRTEFANICILPFIFNGVSGGSFLGHSKAVQFNYPKEILEKDPGMCAYNTVNMAKAITPENPKEQVEVMQEKLPLGLWVGKEDELFDADKVVAYVTNSKVIPEENHLGIVLNAHKWMGPWIEEYILSK